MFLSEKQGLFETSVLGAEFVATNTGQDAVRGLRHKLRMMGVPLADPTFVCGDNMLVIHNTQRTESVLNDRISKVTNSRFIKTSGASTVGS